MQPSNQKPSRQGSALVPNSHDAHDTLLAPAAAPPLAATLPSDEPQRQPLRVANMRDKITAVHTRSEENSVDGSPGLSSLLFSQPTPPFASPAPHISGAIAKSHSNSRGDFAVMLNHQRMVVPAEHPFLNPRDLFLPRATKAIAKDGCGAGPAVAASHPSNFYGDRPVLLLDCTGALRLRRLRRQRRRELQLRASTLTATRADLLRTIKLWFTRRTRARQQHKRLRISETAVSNVGDPDAVGEGDAAASASSSVGEGGVCEKDFFSELSHQRRAITNQMKEVRHELWTLLQEKRKQSAMREGCVLMLPSPDTGLVQLFPGHHYRTVCFVGDELLEVLPSDTRGTDSTTVQHSQHQTPSLRELRLGGTARELSGDDDEGHAEGKHTPAKETSRPPWATAELLGYVIFLSQCRNNPQCGGGGGGGEEEEGGGGGGGSSAPGFDITDCYEGREGHVVDVEKIASTISYDMVDDYLALPACEMAMYREWAIDKFKFLPQEEE
ncbi:hypothetical protein JKF63_07628 [Porcisia hertigi]|uniref:Uncharacterized protein n=1 Tax=Porcisia hertigi TaxID=2761500 RepID=A0A836IQH6_9TRYP|nr:hypothetical protein JKF63_07628 [Porcisia hertigi]